MRTLLLTALSAGLFLCLPSACSSNGAATTGGVACPGSLAEAPNSAFCAGDKSTVNCAIVSIADKEQVCGVAVPNPSPIPPASTPPNLTRSANVMEFAGSGPPDLSCYEMANWPKAGNMMPATATLTGVARIFANGCDSTQVTVEVYTVKRTTDSSDGEIDQLVGTKFVTPMDCTSSSSPSTTAGCHWCDYSYPMVPTDTELVIKTYGPTWAPLYDYNIYVPSSAVKADGTWAHDVRALDSGDYTVIAQTALGSPITVGHGAVAGEVHDCADIRLSGATVDVNVGRKLLTYFTDVELNPLPDTSATSTSALGLYAAIDVVPGPASVAAMGYVGGQLTTVGYYKVQVYPDSVTSITFSGLRPFQIKP